MKFTKKCMVQKRRYFNLKWQLLLLFLLFQCNVIHASGAKKYIEKYHDLVISLSEEYGIPVSVITAISLIESGAGKSKNCLLLKNHFGIIGKNKLMKTKGVHSKFKQYQTDEDSFKDFCKIISRKKYYNKLKGKIDYKLWIEAMAKAGYSTTPDVWRKEMYGAIKANKLHKMDEEKIEPK